MTSTQPPPFGPRLKELREKAGLTQVQLAERSGLHPQGIIKLERGEREPAWATVYALAEALGVSCEAFREEAGEVKERKPGRPRKADAEAPDAAAQPGRGKGKGAAPADLPEPQHKPKARTTRKPRGG